MRATREETRRGLVDFDRISEMLLRNPHIELRQLDRVSPLAAPLLLEMGRVRLGGSGHERLAEKMAQDLMAAAGLDRLTNDKG